VSVHVESLSTEVTAEAAPAAATGGGPPAEGWREEDRIAAALRRRARDRARTRAGGFDD
jgi:hypothetical protein